jgi:hypothetical protein
MVSLRQRWLLASPTMFPNGIELLIRGPILLKQTTVEAVQFQ